MENVGYFYFSIWSHCWSVLIKGVILDQQFCSVSIHLSFKDLSLFCSLASSNISLSLSLSSSKFLSNGFVILCPLSPATSVLVPFFHSHLLLFRFLHIHVPKFIFSTNLSFSQSSKPHFIFPSTFLLVSLSLCLCICKSLFLLLGI